MSWYFYACTGKTKWVPYLSEDRDEIIQSMNPEFMTILEVNQALKSKEERSKDLSFRGPMYFDWDGADEIQDVLDSVKRFMGRLESLGFPLNQAYWYLTGGKGVHCVIPEECFMTEDSIKQYRRTGNNQLPSIYRMLATSESLISNHMDLSIYTGGRGRMWRTPNRARQRADGSTTYKVAISPEALRKLNEESYWEWCSEARPLIKPDAPTRCSQLAVEFSMACNRVEKAHKARQATRDKEVTFEGWSTIPPTIEDAFNGKGILQNLDLNEIKLQLCIAATAVGFDKLADEDRFISAVQGFIQSRVGMPGASHKSAQSIEEALRNCFRSVAETPYYRYTPGGLASILVPELRQNADLSGKHTSETDNTAAIQQRAIELAGEYHSDQDGTFRITSKGGPTTVSTYSWKPGSVLKILDSVGNIIAYSVIPLVNGKPTRRTILPLAVLNDTKRLSMHVMQHGGTAEMSGQGAGTRMRKSWENYAGNPDDLKDAELAEAVPLEGMYIQSRVSQNRTGDEEFSESSSQERDYDSELNIYWVEPTHTLSSTRHSGPETSGQMLPTPQYFDPSNPGGRFGMDLSGANTTLANKAVPGKDAIHALLELNGNFFSLAIILGWLTGCNLKHPLYKLDRIKNFPILQVYGDAGCGKTTTMNLLLRMFTWREPFRVTAAGPGLTEAAFRMLATGTASLPMVVDEVKAQNIGRSSWMHIFRQMLQNVYTIGAVVRKAGGRGGDSHHNELVGDPMYAPVAFIGETLETSQASLMERIAPAGFHAADKNGREKHAQYLLRNPRVMGVIGWTLVQEVMEGSMTELVKLHDDSLAAATEALAVSGNHRIVENGAMILTGFRFFAKMVEKFYPGEFTEKLASMEHALLDASRWMRSTPSEVVRLLSFLALASHDPDFSHHRAIKDVHYWLEPGETAKGTANFPCLSCEQMFMLYRTRMKSIDDTPVFSSSQEMFVALKNSDLVVDAFEHPEYGNYCVKLDPNRLKEAGVREFRLY